MKYKNSRKRDVLSSEAENFIKDAKLARKKLREEEPELIRKLLMDSSLDETISSSHSDSSSSPQHTDEARYVMDRESETRILKSFKSVVPHSVAEKNRERIICSYERSHFFQFVFKEYSKIKDFARRTKVIVCLFIPPGARINGNIRNALNDNLKTAVSDLKSPLEYIENNGWRYLTKAEYNLLAEFAGLCSCIEGINFKRLNVNDTRFRSLNKLEVFFLTCHYKKNYPDIIKRAMNEVLKTDARFEDRLRTYKEIVDVILSENTSQPSLYNFIAGINIIRSRRYINFPELINRGAGAVINTAHFNCRRKVHKKINRYIDDTLRNVFRLRKEKAEVDRLRLFLDMNEEGTVNFNRLYEFINKSNVLQGINAENELENMAEFTIILFSTIIREMVRFLNGEITLANGLKIRVFANDFFKFEIERIRYSLSTLEEMGRNFPTFSRVRYIGLRQSAMRGEPEENEILRLINALVSFIQSVGKKLVHIKQFSVDESAVEGKPAPLDPATIVSRAFSIPYKDEIIEGTGITGGMSVLETIIYIIHLSYLVGMMYVDPVMTALLEREKPITYEMVSLKNTLKRVADPLQFRKIQELYELSREI
jgi:hypothetical protein